MAANMRKSEEDEAWLDTREEMMALKERKKKEFKEDQLGYIASRSTWKKETEQSRTTKRQ